MAKSKKGVSAPAAFTPLGLTPAEKQITRSALTALSSTVIEINDAASEMTPSARTQYFHSLRSWINTWCGDLGLAPGANPAAKAKSRTA